MPTFGATVTDNKDGVNVTAGGGGTAATAAATEQALAVLAEAQRQAQRERDLASPAWRLNGTFRGLAWAFGAAGYTLRQDAQRGEPNALSTRAIVQLAEEYLADVARP